MLFQDGQKVVFTGDSITDAGRGRPVGQGLWEGVGNGYVRQVDNLLTATYPERFIHVANTGCAGNTSRDLLARLDRDVVDLKPDWVVMMIGANDVWRQFDEPALRGNHVDLMEYVRNVSAILDRLQEKGIGVIVMEPYFMEPNRQDPMRIRIEEYAAACRRLCEARGVLCVDTQSAFDEFLKYRYSASLSWDRVHPGHVGQFILARTLLRAIEVDRVVV